MIRSCARLSFEAATIFMALVICCVFLTARTRRRRSMSDGITGRLGGGRSLRREIAREQFHGLVERALELIVELLLLGDAAEQLRMARLEILVQPGLEGADLGCRDGVQIAV